MSAEMVSQVRRFNRTVTQRVGALNDRFLARDRPLGEARVLWEIGPEGRDVRSLRAQLELDSGYLSRLLRTLEAARLITIAAKAGRSEEHTSELQSHLNLVCRLLLEKKKHESLWASLRRA